MILILLAAMLVFALFVLQKYITCGVHSQTHRFLPLILGLIVLNDFYQVIEYLTKAHVIFSFLEKVLLIQMLYLLVHYIMDVLKLQFSGITENVLFTALIAVNAAMILGYDGHRAVYDSVFWGSAAFLITAMILLSSSAYFLHTYSKREHYVNLMLYLSIIVPCIGLLWQNMVQEEWSEVIVPVSLCFTCGIVYYLMMTWQLVDAMTLMKENLYDTSQIAVVLFDEDYYYLDANEAARALFTRELTNISDKRHRVLCRQALQVFLDNPGEGREFMGRGGICYQCSLNPLIYRNRLKGYILCAVDVTKQKRETQLMTQLKELAEDQTAAKSRFLACMSHDLRSPLHAIIGISDVMLGRKELKGRNRSLMRYVKSAGNVLLEQVDSILLFSKLESGKLELNIRPYNLEKILEELTSMCVINLMNRPVNFSIVIRTKHPSQFMGDEIRIREMFQNLLANAVKFTEQGEIRCEITCYEEQDKYRIKCMVSDTGSGINSQQLPGVFGEYASDAEQKGVEGTGLGLAIVKQLAEMMGGNVGVESNGRKGSVFHFEIEQKAAPGAMMRPPVTFNEDMLLRRQAQETEGIVPSWIYPTARVLVVDDMKVNQEILRDLLKPWKCTVDTAACGQEAVEAVRKKSYQLVFLDRMMPDMSGIETASQIRELKSVPIVLVTADPSDDINNYYQKYGFHAFMLKPIDTAQLQNIIETLIPDRFKEKPESIDTAKALEDIGYEGNRRGYRRMLEAFAAEGEYLLKDIAHYAASDHAMFQTKVHGIKGASFQIGENALSEAAEIMEMAAKTDNYTFIEKHMESFMDELQNACQEVKNELARMTIQTGMVTPTQKKHAPEEVFGQLKEGLETYDMVQIEDNLRILHTLELSDEQSRLLLEVQNAYNELEYEKGAELLRDFV